MGKIGGQRVIFPRLKSSIRVSAHLRRVQAAGSFATIARKGDPDAGAIAVKVFVGAARAKLYIQSRDLDGNVIWRSPVNDSDDCDVVEEAHVDAWIKKETSIDPDLWVIEIEDAEGRAFLQEN
ncbi:MAG: DUF1491 family protein [Marinicaulis sp.]|nr:DUF1491 family protein [Marinicaulis sp.]